MRENKVVLADDMRKYLLWLAAKQNRAYEYIRVSDDVYGRAMLRRTIALNAGALP